MIIDYKVSTKSVGTPSASPLRSADGAASDMKLVAKQGKILRYTLLPLLISKLISKLVKIVLRLYQEGSIMHFDHQCLNSLLLLVYRTTASAAISSIHWPLLCFGILAILLLFWWINIYFHIHVVIYQYAMLSKM